MFPRPPPGSRGVSGVREVPIFSHRGLGKKNGAKSKKKPPEIRAQKAARGATHCNRFPSTGPEIEPNHAHVFGTAEMKQWWALVRILGTPVFAPVQTGDKKKKAPGRIMARSHDTQNEAGSTPNGFPFTWPSIHRRRPPGPSGASWGLLRPPVASWGLLCVPVAS